MRHRSKNVTDSKKNYFFRYVRPTILYRPVARGGRHVIEFQSAYNFTFTKFHENRLIIDGVINEKHALLVSSVLMYSVGWS